MDRIDARIQLWQLDQRLRARCAHHEAGHGVIGAVMGVTIFRVALTRDGGNVDFDSSADGWPMLCMLIAGPLAQSKHETGRINCDSIFSPSASEDRKHITAILTAHHGPCRLRESALLRRAIQHTSQLVEQYWAAITAVAAELEWRGELSGAEIETLMERNSRYGEDTSTRNYQHVSGACR